LINIQFISGHRIIEINQTSVVAVTHERIVNMLATATGEIHMKWAYTHSKK